MIKNQLIVAGIHAMQEALSAGKSLRKVYFLRDNRNEQLRLIERECKIRQIPVVYVPRDKLNRLTKANHQGVAGLISPIEFYNLANLTRQLYEEGKNPVFVYLDRITDVRNFGAIARSAYFFGLSAIIVPAKDSADLNEEAIKTSAGALLKIPLSLCFNTNQTIKYLKDSGFQIIAASSAANKKLTDIDFMLPTVIVLGSENKGIQYQILHLADAEVQIPGAGGFDSLNVSAAASILFYELFRQRNFLP